SPPFLTEPVNMESDRLFTNAVGQLETRLAPQDLLDKMMGVEAELGRDRQKGKDRTVDRTFHTPFAT
ncbi:MAG: 2-amino-4-hydroxy-6-hydroxymethyldihydropteridine diphosphokinase, partial [Desulfobacterales bacterium]|nr:2-amino-4-hydroxy-6-hydroxymethyldihydropteridine diphosphokinase [Desulfobacterales bacterium]